MNTSIRSMLTAAFFLCSATFTFAQTAFKVNEGEMPKGWHTMDIQKDGQWGISLNRAYEFFQSKKLKGKPVLVAVIDSGIDTLHEDLQEVLWRNPGEVPNNGKDDDKNGYADDVYGWNFLGNKKGDNVVKDSYEGARVYHGLKSKYDGKSIDESSLTGTEKREYQMWKKAAANVLGSAEEPMMDLLQLKQIVRSAKKNDSILCKAMNKETYTVTDLDAFDPEAQNEKVAKNMMTYLFRGNEMEEMTNKQFLEGFQEFLDAEEAKAEAKDKAPEAYRDNVVEDDENDINDRYYGNGNVMVSLKAAEHGTHVAGIIAASRNNGKGMDGIADNVRIMMIRAVPDGDEHDKDIALAIRYAVDNGAKIINMSFGKSFSPQKTWVDEAVAYAEKKGVLLVHAAGNDHKNIDSNDNFPNPNNLTLETRASNWITVGASSNGNMEKDGFTASFSNYGKDQVDVFAPGHRIYATYPGGDQYRSLDGTSMASPVVAGTAALLLSYFPHLTPQQLKKCIEEGSTNPQEEVDKPGTEETVAFNELCRTGALLNAYGAAVIAASIPAPQKAAEKPRQPAKPTLKQKKD